MQIYKWIRGIGKKKWIRGTDYKFWILNLRQTCVRRDADNQTQVDKVQSILQILRHNTTDQILNIYFN